VQEPDGSKQNNYAFRRHRQGNETSPLGAQERCFKVTVNFVAIGAESASRTDAGGNSALKDENRSEIQRTSMIIDEM
jgi:hypothetical protein